MSNEPTIAKMLEDARIRRGLSQRRAAEWLHTTPRTWKDWQRGQAPGARWAGGFAEFTNQDEAYILRRLFELEEGVDLTMLERMGQARYALVAPPNRATVAQLVQPTPVAEAA